MLKQLLKKHERLITYGLISVLILIIDTAIVRILVLQGVLIVIANTIGTLTGSLVQYFLNMKFAFKQKVTTTSFFYHVITFIMGIILANIVIYIAYRLGNKYLSEELSFYVAKGLSVVIPFFAMYFARVYLYRDKK